MKSSTIKIATILALSTAVISGVANFANRFAVGAMGDPILFTTLKNGLVAFGLIGTVLLLGKIKEIRSLSRPQWLHLLAIGAIGGALPFALFFTGLAQTSAINAALIHKTLFLWVAFMAIPLLKERMVWQQWLGIAVVFVGNLFIGGFEGFKLNIGEIMILGATILWAVENVIAKKALADVSSTTVGAARMVIGSVFLIGYVALFGGGFSPVLMLTSAQWGLVILVSLLLSGYVLTWYAALSRAPATFVATILVLATVVTNLLSSVFVTHTLSGGALVSGIFYVLGASILIYFTFKTSSQIKSFDNKTSSASI